MSAECGSRNAEQERGNRNSRGCGATIVVYHRVTDEVRTPLTVSTRRFRAQIAYLRRFYRVVPLSAVIATLRDGGRFARPTAAITFDDGYRDNLTVAAPVLCEFGCPATLFVATAPQEAGEVLWWDLLALAGKGASDQLAWVKGLSHGDFCRAIGEARAAVPAERQAREAQRLYLTWDEVRQWQAFGFDLGAHTVNHPIVSRLTPEQVRAEVRQSRAALERATGRPITTFAYPNGGPGDFTAETRRILAEEGFAAACTTLGGANHPGCDLLALRRHHILNESLPLFATRISRLAPALRRLKNSLRARAALAALAGAATGTR